MSTLRQLPRLPDLGLMGCFGASTAERLALQRSLAAQTAPLMVGRILHVPVL